MRFSWQLQGVVRLRDGGDISWQAQYTLRALDVWQGIVRSRVVVEANVAVAFGGAGLAKLLGRVA